MRKLLLICIPKYSRKQKRQGKSKNPQRRTVRVVKNKVKRTVKAVSRPALKLTECAAKYAVAIIDPWDKLAMGACVPMAPARPTMKVCGFLRGIVHIGTAGIGFIAASPCIANNIACVYHSASSFAGSTIEATTFAILGVVHNAISNLPFTRTNLVDGGASNVPIALGRIVSAGLSLRYIGTEYNRGGRVMCYSEPTHESINTYTTSVMGAKLESEFSTPGPNRNKCWITTNGIDSEELEFPDVANFMSGNEQNLRLCYPLSRGEKVSNNTGDDTHGAVIMGALISGLPGDVYEYEYIQHCEYTGSACQSRLTPNFADPDGTAMIQTAAARSKLAKASSSRSLKQVFKQELLSVAKEHSAGMMARGGALLLSAL